MSITPEQLALMQQEYELLQRRNDLSDKEKATRDALKVAIEAENEARFENLDLLKQSLKFSEENLELLEKEASAFSNINDRLGNYIKIAREQLDVLRQKKSLATSQEEQEYLDILIESQRNLIQQYEVQNQKIQNNIKSTKFYTEAAEKGIQKIQSAASGLNSAMGGMFPIANVLSFSSIMNILGQAMREAADANAKLVASTGQLASTIGGFGPSLGGFGILYKDQAAAYGELYNTMTGFSSLSRSTAVELTNSAARMKNLGVDVGTTGRNFDFLTKSLRFGISDAMNLTDRMAKVAMGAGIAPSKMAKDFSTAFPQLAGYGKKAVEVFFDLEKQSKSLGIEMQGLMGIVGSAFDTFEGSADRVGKLNAMLGGPYLNAVEMTNANEAERTRLLKEAFEASGKNLDSLGKYGQIYVKNALGAKDLSEVQMLLGKSSTEMTKDMNTQEASQQKLIATQKAAGDVAAKMEAANRALAGNIPGLTKLVQLMQELSKEIMKFVAEYPKISGFAIMMIAGAGPALSLTSTVTGLVGSFKSLSAAKELKGSLDAMSIAMSGTGNAANTAANQIGNVSSAANNVKNQVGNVTPAVNGMSGGMQGAGAAASSTAANIAAFGFAVLLIGVGIAAASFGLAELVKAFKDLNATQADAAITAITVAMGGFILMMVALGAVLYFAAPAIATAGTAMIPFGAAIALVGLGIGLAALGMSELVKAFGGLAKEGIGPVSEMLGALAITIGISVIGIAALAGVTAVAWPALGFLAAGLALVTLAFFGMAFAVQLAMDPLIELSKISGGGNNLSNIAKGIKDISDAMSGLSSMSLGGIFDNKFSKITDFLKDTKDVFQEWPADFNIKAAALKQVEATIKTAGTTSAEQLKPSVDFIKEVKSLYDAQAKAAEAQAGQMSALIKAVSKDSTGAPGAMMPVVIKLSNDRELFGMMNIPAGTAFAGQGPR